MRDESGGFIPTSPIHHWEVCPAGGQVPTGARPSSVSMASRPNTHGANMASGMLGEGNGAQANGYQDLEQSTAWYPTPRRVLTP